MVVPVKASWALESPAAMSSSTRTIGASRAVPHMDSAPGRSVDSVHYRENGGAASTSRRQRRLRESTGRRPRVRHAGGGPARRLRDHRPPPPGAATVPPHLALLPDVMAALARPREPASGPVRRRRPGLVRAPLAAGVAGALGGRHHLRLRRPAVGGGIGAHGQPDRARLPRRSLFQRHHLLYAGAR